MAVHLEITTENLLNAVVQMPENEFKRFVEKARKIRRKVADKPNISPMEADLLHKINNIFSSAKRQRYNELYKRFKNNELVKNEYEELLELSNEFEILNAERLGFIGELAKLRGQSLEQVMDFFEITNSSNE